MILLSTPILSMGGYVTAMRVGPTISIKPHQFPGIHATTQAISGDVSVSGLVGPGMIMAQSTTSMKPGDFTYASRGCNQVFDFSANIAYDDKMNTRSPDMYDRLTLLKQ